MADKKAPSARLGHTGRNIVDTGSLPRPEQNGKIAFDTEYDKLWRARQNNKAGSAKELGKPAHDGNAAKQAAPPLEENQESDEVARSPELYQPFPVEALPLPLSRFVGEASAAIGCDESYVALPLLAALAGTVGNRRSIRLKRGWVEPSVGWCVIIGKSGQLKSPALDSVLRPLHDNELAATKQHGEAMERFARDVALYEADVQAWKGKGRKAGEPPPEKPKPPVCPRVVISDCTTEAVAALLAENPLGLLLARDELAGWFKSFDAYRSGRGGDVQGWLTMFGARPLVVDRKTGPQKTTVVPKASVSICGGVQPEVFKRVLGFEHFENGLAARPLLAYPPPRVKRWTEAELSDTTRAELAELFNKLRALEPCLGPNGELTPRVLPLTASGKRVLVPFLNAHAVEQAELGSDNLGAAWSKLEGYAGRLALLIHLVRQVSGDELETPDGVDAASVQAAVELVRWFAHEAKRVYQMFGELDEEREQRELVEWIRGRGGKVTARDVAHGPRQYRNANDSQAAAQAALDKLAKAGLGAWQAVPTTTKGGRPTSVFALAGSKTPLAGTTTYAKPAENIGFGSSASGATLRTNNPRHLERAPEFDTSLEELNVSLDEAALGEGTLEKDSGENPVLSNGTSGTGTKTPKTPEKTMGCGSSGTSFGANGKEICEWTG